MLSIRSDFMTGSQKSEIPFAASSDGGQNEVIYTIDDWISEFVAVVAFRILRHFYMLFSVLI